MNTDTMIGTVLDGRYRVERVLGEGGFGVVYAATQLSTRQPVAVKVLRAQQLQGAKAQKAIARFEREMNLIAKLHHPNIVRLLDTGQTEAGQLYTVLELVAGVELEAFLEARGKLEPKLAKRLMLEVLDALSCAHEQGIVHRDLKPANIMVTTGSARPNAMVLDFGISGVVKGYRDTHYKTLTAAGQFQGTPFYMAPEQLLGKGIDTRIDLYAWGLVFIELLSGRRAIDGSKLVDIVSEHLSPDPVPLPDALSNHPLGEVLRRATAKDAEERFDTAAEALLALEDCSVADLDLPAPTPRLDDAEAPTLTAESLALDTTLEPDALGATMDAEVIRETLDPVMTSEALGATMNATSARLDVDPSPDEPTPRSDTTRDEDSAPDRKNTLIIVTGLALTVAVLVALFWTRQGDAPPSAEDATTREQTTSAAPEADVSDEPDTLAPAEVSQEPPAPRFMTGMVLTPPGTRGAEMVFISAPEAGTRVGATDSMLEAQRALCASLVPERYCTDAFTDQRPAFTASVEDLFVDRTEVTNAHYRACVKAGDCEARDFSACALIDPARGTFSLTPPSADAAAQLEETLGAPPNLPATCVNRAEAVTFCRWAGKSLPDETEWELAASGGDPERLFPWGGPFDGAWVNGADQALAEGLRWSDDAPIALHAIDDGHPFSTQVRALPGGRSPEGVYELAGNAQEWTRGPFTPYPLDAEASEDDEGVARGGSWAAIGAWLGVRARAPLAPTERRTDLGLRCILPLSQLRTR